MTPDPRLQRPRMTLSELPAGAAARVCTLNAEPDLCQRLREMGFCESAVVQKISGRSTLLCQVCGMRVALGEGVARHITVELVRAAG